MTVRRGEIYVEVRPAGGAAGAVRGGHAQHRELVALGTRFDVRVAAETTSLVVTQGKVQVRDLHFPVPAGQQLTLDAAGRAGGRAGQRTPWRGSAT